MRQLATILTLLSLFVHSGNCHVGNQKLVTVTEQEQKENLCTVQPLGISGLVAAVFTPFDDDFNLDVSIVPCQAKYLNSTGVSWIFVSGTTGESVSLTLSEREKLIDAWVSIAPTYNMKLIIMVGANCLADARSLASYAASQDKSIVKGIAAMPQSFFKAATVEALALSMKYISDAAIDLPFYYYHIPSLDSITFSMYDLIVASKLPNINFTNLVGIKYTGLYNNPSFDDITSILNHFDNSKIEVLTGRDQMLLQGLSANVKGMVGSQYNFAAELYNTIINNWNNNILNNNNCTKGNGYDTMKQLSSLQSAAIDLLTLQSNNVSSTTNGAKYLNKIITKCNVGDSRFPWLPASDSDKTQIENALKKWCQTNSDLVSFC